MTTTVTKAIRSDAAWSADQSAMEALYGVGGYYTTLSAWEAALPASLVTNDEIHVAECYNDWPDGLNDSLSISGSIVNGTCYAKVTVAEGHRHNGTPKTGFYIKKASNTLALVAAPGGYAQIEWIEVDNSNTGSTSYVFSNFPNSSTVKNCIAILSGGGGSTYAAAFSSASVSNTNGVTWTTFINCLAIGGTVGNAFSASNSTQNPRCKIYNCVVKGFAKATGSGICEVSNTVAFGCTTVGFGGAQTGTCASSDTSATYTGSVQNITSAEFVDSANNDFHLASGSALIGVGTNLYSLFTDDIDGDIRPSSGAWDIGFDHYVAAAGGHDVAAENATSQPAASSAAISQTHPVAASNATSSPSASTAAISQTHKVAVASASSTPAASAAAITQTHKVSAANATSTPAASDAQISQGSTHLVAGTNASSTPTASTAAIRQTHTVAGTNATSAPAASAAAVAQSHLVAGTNAASAPVASTASVGQTHKVTAASATSTPAASAAAISQGAVHLVSASNASSQPAASAAAVAQSHRVAAANATSQPAASAAGIVQGAVHLIGAANSASQPSASAAAIGQTHAIAAMGSSIPSTASDATIKQIHLIDGTNATSIVTASGGAILIPGSEEAIPRESSTYRATRRYTTYLSTRRLTTYPAARRPDAY